MDISQYLDMFIEESKDHLQSINDNLLALERTPNDLAIVNEILRSAHTLKGMAASMGFEQMARLTHAMEDGFELIKCGQLEITGTFIDTLLACTDRLETQLAAIIECGSDTGIDVADVLHQLAAAIDRTHGRQETALELDDSILLKSSMVESARRGGSDVYKIRVRFHPDCSMPAVRAYMVVKAYKGLGEILWCMPTIEELTEGQLDGELTLILATEAEKDKVHQEGLSVSEVASVVVETVNQDSAADEHVATTKVPAASAQSRYDSRTPYEGTKRQSSRSIRVDIHRLDALMNLMSELVMDRTRLEELSRTIKNPGLSETVRHLSRIGAELQEIVMKIRMVPVETVFNRFPRMVRDLARTLNKQVELQITGAETELDRTIADEIGDPLVHILRNALDHGLESPQERVASGKRPIGMVHLSAYQSGNHVYIEIRDDGRGIDRSKVLNKAIERGLIEPSKADGLTETQVFDLLFQSGFSTAETVSDISGRGVGLDVVKSKIQSLGGDVTINSKVGEGTAFIIELPLTLSILPAMMVSVANEQYAIPLHSIIQMQKIARDDIRRAHGQETIQFQGRVIPLLDLATLFSVRSQFNTPYVNAVILRKGERMIALAVDAFLGQQDIVLKSLGSYFSHPVNGIAGATILGTGYVALVLDPNSLLR